MTPQQLIVDFEKNKRYGSLEFEFRAGELTFVRRKETLIPHSEKNSAAVPVRRENGTYNRDANQTY
jgi:hypothetical protein